MEERSPLPPSTKPPPPSSVRTFLIADLRGYTRFTDEQGDEAAARLTQHFASVAEEVVSASAGTVVETRGDEILAVFDSPRDGIRAAVALQLALETDQDPELPLRAGIGLDAGEAVPVNGGYRGRALNMAARLCARARPGQTLVTPELVHLAGSMDGIVFEDSGPVHLKGFTRPVRLNLVVPLTAEARSGTESASGSLQFRVLGPLEATSDGRPISLGGPRQRLVLAHLILDANRVVSMEHLIDRVWGEDPPAAARNTIQGYVSQLRAAIGADRIEWKAPGYVLHAEADEVDVLRLERSLRRARRQLSIDPASATTAFEEALGLWHGSPFADLADSPSLAGEIARLDEIRLSATEDLLRARLALSEHAQAIPELQRLTASHPLRERLWEYLMLALYRSGRQADALEVFGRARQQLADELGIDPSSELRDLHERILRQDPELALQGRPLRSYRLIEQIGEGAFGVVWRALDPGVGRQVAVKQIHPRFAQVPEFVRRFEQEAHVVAGLEHPHVVPIYDFWRDGTGAYLVMRWMQGGSLADSIATGPMTSDDALRILDQVAAGLSAAHRRRLVHRDVKPGNILLDEEGNAYLSDFGIAGPEDEAAGSSSQRSPAYRSPEQARGHAATRMSDIFSLGMVMYEMLVGDRGDTVRSSLASEAPRRPSALIRELRPDLPPAVQGVLDRATAEDPAARFDDARELAVAFRAALAVEEPPSAAIKLPSEPRNPYKGLRPFSEADADDFFGRDALLTRLVARMSEEPAFARLLAVVGPSGSGKSSVVRAGLIPALRAGAIPGSERWFYAEMLPGPRPMEELEAALLRAAVDPPDSLVEQLDRDDHGLVRAVDRILPDDDTELFLLVDQFEELFTLVEGGAATARFLESLVVAVTDPTSRLRVVATLRADFYDRPLSYPGMAELIESRTQTVVPLSHGELERAIAGPAERVGVIPELALMAEIVGDVTDQPGALPLVQYALTETFERRRDGVLTLESYRQTGGVTGALPRRAEELLAGMNETRREAARQLFLRLVTIGEGTEDTRRLVPRSELASLEIDPKAMDAVIEVFGSHRLLSFDRDPDTRGPTVEVAHEALLREWGRLRGWIDSAREDVIMHRRLVAEAAEWDRSARDPSFLLRGSRLTQFEAWSDTTALALSAAERQYIRESVRLRAEELTAEKVRVERERALERRSVIRLRALVAVLTAAALVASGLTVLAAGQRDRAERQRRIATARELATAAVASLEVDPQRSILLSLAAVDTTRQDGTVLREAEEALHRAVAADRELLTLETNGWMASSADGNLIATGGIDESTPGNDVFVWDARTGDRLQTLTTSLETTELGFSPDGLRLVALVTGDGSTVYRWDTRSWQELPRLNVGREVPFPATMAFSPDGGRLAVTGADGIVSILDAVTGRLVQELRDPRRGFLGVTFSRDGARVAAAPNFNGDLIPVWDIRTGRKVLELIGGNFSVAYSPDGSRLAAGDGGGTPRVFDAQTGEELLTLQGHTGPVWGVQFSPDGQVLATSGEDGTARVWDAHTGKQLLVLHGHAGTVFGFRFSPDGRRLVTAGGDNTVRVWDISSAGSRELVTVEDPLGLQAVSYSPDGSRLLAVSGWGADRVWDASTGRLIASAWSDSGDAAFSPDGERFVTAGTPTIRDASSGEDVRAMDVREGDYYPNIAYSPDGSLVAGGLSEGTPRPGTVTVWDAATGARVRTLGEAAGRIDTVSDVAFSPDGSLLAGIDFNAKVHVWNVSSGQEILSFQGQSETGHVVAFSSDGSLLATSGADGAAVWKMPSGKRAARFTGHAGVLDVAFSPDGMHLATANQDQTASIWDVATGTELLTLGSTGSLNSVAFSPDGTELATSSDDGTVRVLALQIDDLVKLARAHLSRGFSEAECRQYLHDTCPASTDLATPLDGPSSAGAPNVSGPEGAFGATIAPGDLRIPGLPRRDRKDTVGRFTLSLENGSWRLHQDLPNGDTLDSFGSYEVSGRQITFVERNDPACLGWSWSGRWSLRAGTSLSFAIVSPSAASRCDLPVVVAQGVMGSALWTRIV